MRTRITCEPAVHLYALQIILFSGLALSYQTNSKMFWAVIAPDNSASNITLYEGDTPVLD